jgi:hypothetical protein
MTFKRRAHILVALTLLALIGGVLGTGPVFASELPNDTLPDGSHCDKKTWSPRGNFMVNYTFDHDYRTDHYYQVYKAISTAPNPSFLGDPNVDTWYSTVRCG